MIHMQSEAVEENKGTEMQAHFSAVLAICSPTESNSRKAIRRGSLLNRVMHNFIDYVRCFKTI